MKFIKILVYGAGVIGSIFAYKLKSGGNDVSILARGKRLEDLKKYGLIVQDDITIFETSMGINITGQALKGDKVKILSGETHVEPKPLLILNDFKFPYTNVDLKKG